MSDLLKVECPHCGGSLKLKDRSAEGKKVRCPKCEEIFRVELPPEDLDDVDDFDEFNDDFGDDEMQEEEPRPKKGKGGKKTAKKKGKGGGVPWLLVGLVCLGVVAVGGLGFVVVKFAGGGGGGAGNKIDLTYTLPDSDFIVRVKVNEIYTSPLLSELIAQIPQPPGGFGGVTPKDIDTVTIAGIVGQNTGAAFGGPVIGFGQTNPSARGVIVVRTKVPLKPEDMKEFKASGATHGGKTIYKKAAGDAAMGIGSGLGLIDSVIFPESTVMVLASEADAKTIIDQGSTQKRRSDLDFLNPDHTILFAVVQKGAGNPNAVIQSPASEPNLQALEKAMNKSVRSIALGTRITDHVDVEIMANCDTSSGAGELKSAIDAVFADLKKKYEQSKTLLTLMDMGDVITLGDKAVGSLKASQSGTKVTAEANIPSDLKTVAQSLQKKMMGGMGGGFGGGPPPGFSQPPM